MLLKLTARERATLLTLAALVLLGVIGYAVL